MSLLIRTDVIYGPSWCLSAVQDNIDDPSVANALSYAYSSLDYIKHDISNLRDLYFKLGFHLYEVKVYKYYEALGFDNIYDFALANFDLDHSLVSRHINVFTHFAAYDSSGVYKMWIADKYKPYSFSQLVEMLPMHESDLELVKPEMSVRQIRDLKRQISESKSGVFSKVEYVSLLVEEDDSFDDDQDDYHQLELDSCDGFLPSYEEENKPKNKPVQPFSFNHLSSLAGISRINYIRDSKPELSDVKLCFYSSTGKLLKPDEVDLTKSMSYLGFDAVNNTKAFRLE